MAENYGPGSGKMQSYVATDRLAFGAYHVLGERIKDSRGMFPWRDLADMMKALC